MTRLSRHDQTLKSDQLIRQIHQLQRDIHDMDIKVRRFLADRKLNPTPGHEALLRKIRDFVDGLSSMATGFKKTEIDLRSDGLIHSALVHERIWRRLFEQRTENLQQKAEAHTTSPVPPLTPGEPPAFGETQLERLYRVAQHKWTELGLEPVETRSELFERLTTEHAAQQPHLQPGQRIGFIFKTGTGRIELIVLRT